MNRLPLLLTLFASSCVANTVHEQDEQLLGWTNEFVMEDGEHATAFYMDHERFIAPYFSTEYKTDTLTVSTLMEVNSCAEIVADIKVSNDTLFLSAKRVSSEACASVTFNKLTYVVHNPANTEFVIISGQ